MKIIEAPDANSWSHPYTCDNCETKLEIEVNDINHTHSSRDGIYPPSENYSACCPVCSHYFCVLVKDLPKIIQIEAQKRSARARSSYLD